MKFLFLLITFLSLDLMALPTTSVRMKTLTMESSLYWTDTNTNLPICAGSEAVADKILSLKGDPLGVTQCDAAVFVEDNCLRFLSIKQCRQP